MFVVMYSLMSVYLIYRLLKYYFGNCFLLVLECFTFIILVFLVTDWKPFDGWAMTLAFVGSAAIFGRFYIAVSQ
jgi:hypothetical protein